jgi:hypothetical protein
MRRQDVYDENGRRYEGSGDTRLDGVLDVLQQCMAGRRPTERTMLGAMDTLLGMIGEEKRKRAASTLGPQQPVDVQDPRASRLVTDESLPDTTSQTVEDEVEMGRIMDDMQVPEEAREIAPQILNNVVDNGDGSFSSADGSVRMGTREQLIYMMQRTMQEIGEEIRRRGGHAVADVGPDLRTRLTTRGVDGRRSMVTVEPRLLENG